MKSHWIGVASKSSFEGKERTHRLTHNECGHKLKGTETGDAANSQGRTRIAAATRSQKEAQKDLPSPSLSLWREQALRHPHFCLPASRPVTGYVPGVTLSHPRTLMHLSTSSPALPSPCLPMPRIRLVQ